MKGNYKNSDFILIFRSGLNLFLTPASFKQIQITQCTNNNPVHKFRHPHHLYRTSAHNGCVINVTDVEKQGKKLDGKRCSGVTGTRNAIENDKTQRKNQIGKRHNFYNRDTGRHQPGIIGVNMRKELGEKERANHQW